MTSTSGAIGSESLVVYQRHEDVEEQQQQIISNNGGSPQSYQNDESSNINQQGNNTMNDADEIPSTQQQPLFHWKFTDFDQIGEYSRDGSIYATDEVFNSASHLSATLLSLLGTCLLISEASAKGDAWKIVSFSIYGGSLIFLFTASTLHHSIVGSIEHTLRTIDYIAIYPLIAGTFTPLCLVYFHADVIGWTFFGVVWSVAIGGILMTAFWFTKIPKWLSMTMYITLGWMGALMTYWLLPFLGWGGFSWLLGGGVLYTVGGYVFTTETPSYIIQGRFGFHEIWHIAVVLAAFCHWILMYFYVLQFEDPQEEGYQSQRQQGR